MAFRDSDIKTFTTNALSVRVGVEGMRNVERELQLAHRYLVQSHGFATEYQARMVWRASQKMVPYDEGDLKASGKIDPEEMSDGKSVYQVVYDAEYAAAVHEGIGKNFQQGKDPEYPDAVKQAKYLETASSTYAKAFPQTVAEFAESAITDDLKRAEAKLNALRAATPNAQRGLGAGVGGPRLVKRTG